MRWINVKHQLPPEGKDVLFVSGLKKVKLGYFESSLTSQNNWATKNRIWIFDLMHHEKSTASHWMPLPLPPEESEYNR